MKVLLKTGSENEQRLRAAVQQQEDDSRMQLQLQKSEADAREAAVSDKLVKTEIQVQRLSSELRLLRSGAKQQESLQQSMLDLLDRVALREETLRYDSLLLS